ncbi:hypothetical protein Hanom_Chr16g01522131 [Helianthus anomalus]
MPNSSTASPKAKTRRKLSMGLCPAEHGAVPSSTRGVPSSTRGVPSEHGVMVSLGTKDKPVEASIAHHGAVFNFLQAHLL